MEEYMCIKCGVDIYDKYEYETQRCMCESCWEFYVSNNPEEDEEY